MSEEIKGYVLVTGAGAGIGAETTKQLAAAGYRVFAGVHTADVETADLANVERVPLDVTDPGSVEAAAKRVAEAVGGRGLRAVINNAGVIVQGPLELVPAAELRRQFEVNTLGPARVIQAFLPLLRQGQGRIVNISAPTARVPIPFMAPIGASKAALQSFSDSLRVELTPWNIPVVVVEPGATDTAIFAKADSAADAALESVDRASVALYRDQLAAVRKASARQKLGPAEVVAKAIVRAVAVRKPRRRYLAGTGVGMIRVLALLPTRLRERLIKTVFGLG